MARLPSGHADALDALLSRLDGLDHPWALTGSTSFALQGLDLKPDDIDVQTDRAGAHAIEGCLETGRIEPVHWRLGDRIRSWFGRFELEGVQVEVMGDIERRVDGEWLGPIDVMNHRLTIPWRGYHIPVLELAYEARAYEQLGRTTRASQLRAKLE